MSLNIEHRIFEIAFEESGAQREIAAAKRTPPHLKYRVGFAKCGMPIRLLYKMIQRTK
jgi:hypothetical protein